MNVRPIEILLAFANDSELKLFKIEIEEGYFVCCIGRADSNFKELIKEFKIKLIKNAKLPPDNIKLLSSVLENHEIHKHCVVFREKGEIGLKSHDLWFLDVIGNDILKIF